MLHQTRKHIGRERYVCIRILKHELAISREYSGGIVKSSRRSKLTCSVGGIINYIKVKE